MTRSDRPKLRTGLSPMWAGLPRRHCDDCGKKYKPVRPVKEGERGFCCATCRKSYHKHGGAYRKLRDLTRKMMERHLETIPINHIEGELRELRTLFEGLEANYGLLKNRIDLIEPRALVFPKKESPLPLARMKPIPKPEDSAR